MAIKSRDCYIEVCAHMNVKQSELFYLGDDLQQRCILSPLLFIIYMDCMNKLSQTNVCATIGRYKINQLLFADD